MVDLLLIRLENQIPKDDPSTPGEKPYDQMNAGGNDNFLDFGNFPNNPEKKPSPFGYGFDGSLYNNNNNNPFSPINPYPDWQQQDSRDNEPSTGSVCLAVPSNALFLAIIIKTTNFHQILILIAEFIQF